MPCLPHVGVSGSVHACSACICRRICWFQSEWQQWEFLMRRRSSYSIGPRQNARGLSLGTCSACLGRRDSSMPCLSPEAARVEHRHQPWLPKTVAMSSCLLMY